MRSFINEPPALSVHPPQTVRRSCQQCEYIGETSNVKCPRCGSIPLLSLSKLKYRGALKIGRGILALMVFAAMPLSFGSFSLFGETSFISEILRRGGSGSSLAVMLIIWAAVILLLGAGTELVAGGWLIFFAKPNRTILKLNLVLYGFYVLTSIAFIIFSKI